MMRDTLATAMKEAMKAKDSRRLSTIRMVQSEIKSRDIANRGVGKDEASDDDILQILQKLIKQREESAKMYDEGGRAELAQQEREEIEVIRSFMPAQMSDDEILAAAKAVIAEINAEGMRDMGKVIAALRERYAGQMDFGKASGFVKDLLK
ncbi:GatB/YqeY domain-containing protein [Rhizobium helianthi]|uniref:GatB/YqeY domain-containing protein n=1 Tax=Rhizobium helianthi TaxID=1132695 RepID=A0ABW4M8J9_9HYPH